MNKIMEEITVSTQIFPTATTAKSASAAVDMSQYNNAVAKLFAHRLPDGKGEGVITLSIYQNTSTTLAGAQVAASVVTGSITSASDVYLEAEIKQSDLTVNSGYRYIYAHVVTATSTWVAATIERGKPRYEDI
jgi:hypothetical protein